MKTFNLILLLTFLFSCSSTTIIKTNQPGTKIFVDGKYLGIDSVVYTDSKVSFSKTNIVTKNDDCGEENFLIRKNEKIDYQALLGSIFLIVPVLWITKYSPVRKLNISCN